MYILPAAVYFVHNVAICGRTRLPACRHQSLYAYAYIHSPKDIYIWICTFVLRRSKYRSEITHIAYMYVLYTIHILRMHRVHFIAYIYVYRVQKHL